MCALAPQRPNEPAALVHGLRGRRAGGGAGASAAAGGNGPADCGLRGEAAGGCRIGCRAPEGRWGAPWPASSPGDSSSCRPWPTHPRRPRRFSRLRCVRVGGVAMSAACGIYFGA